MNYSMSFGVDVTGKAVELWFFIISVALEKVRTFSIRESNDGFK